jgi:hypothetical protein
LILFPIFIICVLDASQLITYKSIVDNVTNTVIKLEDQFAPLAQMLAAVATGEVDSAEILAAQKKVATQIKSMRTLLSTFEEFKQTAIAEINQVKETGNLKGATLLEIQGKIEK